MSNPRPPLQKRSSGDQPPGAKSSSLDTRWWPAIAAITVLAVVVLGGAFGDDDDPSSASASTGATSTTIGSTGDTGYGITGLTVPASTLPAIGTETTVAGAPKTTLTQTLGQGNNGPEVKAVQTRLAELGFAPGVADGVFGDQTKQAVWAFEKLVLRTPRADATGRVSNDMWQRMQDPLVVQPRRPGTGTHVEIYLPEQVAAVFTDNKATLVIHISSGTAMTPDRTPENSWCEPITLTIDANGKPIPVDEQISESWCGVSFTPGGVFRFTRQEEGHYVGALGGMDNPIYFNYGIAMHGAANVPLEPASHGCIRMHKKISESFQSLVQLKDRVYVWGEDGREPEDYSVEEMKPVFNRRDPSATTSTTTTVAPTTTTLPPATTVVTTVPPTEPAATTTPLPTPTTTGQ